MQILSVNIGNSGQVLIKNRPVETGIYKIPVSGPAAVTRYGLEGDVRVEKREMGLEHSAVYAYPFEHYGYWQRELGRNEPFPMGQFGENLTVTGLLEEEVRIGDVFRFGNTVLQVAHPRIPCNKLNARMGLRFASMFLASRKVGYYLRVLKEGTVTQGDSIELLERDEASPTMEEFVRVTHYEYWDVAALQHLLRARDLMPAWREIIESKLVQARNATGWHGLRELEVVRREPESEDTVSLYLQCAKGRRLAPFRGGQQLMVVSKGSSARQLRRSYSLSGNPQDISRYRITVSRVAASDTNQPGDDLTPHLSAIQTGERILCSAPFGDVPEQADLEHIPVLVSQGLGIAPVLSMLYELEAQQVRKALLFHEPAALEPQGLLHEVETLLKQNTDFQIVQARPGEQERIDAELIARHVPLAQADVRIAGPGDFVVRLMNELKAVGIMPLVLKV